MSIFYFLILNIIVSLFYSNKKNIIFCLFSSGLLILYYNVCLELPDKGAYTDIFLFLKQEKNLNLQHFDYEILFLYFANLLSFIFDQNQTYILIQFLCIFLKTVLLKKIFKINLISFILYICCFSYFDSYAIRQSLASVFLSYGFYFFLIHKKIFSVLFFILAPLFHVGAIIFPFFFLFYKILPRKNQSFKFILICICLVSSFLPNINLELIDQISKKFNFIQLFYYRLFNVINLDFSLNFENARNYSVSSAMALLVILSSLLLQKNIMIKERKKVSLACFSISISNLLSHSYAANRFPFYTYWLYPLLFSQIFSQIKSKKIKNILLIIFFPIFFIFGCLIQKITPF